MAQGRVWSGTDAKNNGLIDELGGLDDAVKAAAQMVNLETYGTQSYPKYKSGLERFMEDFGGATSKVKQNFIKEELGDDAYRILSEVKSGITRKGVQARMPYILTIK